MSCPALPGPVPPEPCQVLTGGVGARGGDGWRLSSPGSRNANSARNGEATGGGGEAPRLPQPRRCRRDFSSRARPPPRSPPGTSSAGTSGPGHKSIRASAWRGPQGSWQITATPQAGDGAAICQRGRPCPARPAGAVGFKGGRGNARGQERRLRFGLSPRAAGRPLRAP